MSGQREECNKRRYGDTTGLGQRELSELPTVPLTSNQVIRAAEIVLENERKRQRDIHGLYGDH